MSNYKYGQIHGRFQPFHNGHLEYLLAAKKRCDFLWIGITQIDIRELSGSPVDEHRQKPENNPLTYFERVRMIKEVCHEEKIDNGQFAIMPFPIETPEILPDFLSTDVPILTTIYDRWNEYKVQVLEQIGYPVEVLWRREVKEVRGTAVRSLIVQNQQEWRDLVPKSAVKFIEQIDLKARLSNF